MLGASNPPLLGRSVLRRLVADDEGWFVKRGLMDMNISRVDKGVLLGTVKRMEVDLAVNTQKRVKPFAGR